MDAWLDTLIGSMAELLTQNLWFAPILSLLAGIVTSFTPCSLSAVPMVIAYMEGTSLKDKKKGWKLSLTMALGMAVTFGVFGSVASVIGHIMHDVGRWWSCLMGVLMILMAFQMWDVIRIFPRKHTHSHSHETGEFCEACELKHTSRKGYLGAFLTGAFGGVLASHCAAPVMVALLAIVAQTEHSPLWGIFLMVLYALGHSILLVLAGTSYSLVDGWLKNPSYARAGNRLKLVVGTVILLIGLLLIFA